MRRCIQAFDWALYILCVCVCLFMFIFSTFPSITNARHSSGTSIGQLIRMIIWHPSLNLPTPIRLLAVSLTRRLSWPTASLQILSSCVFLTSKTTLAGRLWVRRHWTLCVPLDPQPPYLQSPPSAPPHLIQPRLVIRWSWSCAMCWLSTGR